MRVYFATDHQINTLSPCVVCLGFFDGVHRGHMALIENGKNEARRLGLPLCVHTFDIPPKDHQGVPVTREITPLPIKTDILKQAGVDVLYVESFTPEFKALSPEAFVEQVLKEKLQARAVVAGFHYTFGRGGKGDVKLLKALCEKAGIAFLETPAVKVDGHIAASRRIREMIGAGDMEGAALMLGRPYYIQSPVLPGLQIGRQIDFPTINQDFPLYSIIPSLGVYFTRTTVGGKIHYSITNVGKRPTVGEFHDVRVETNIFDFQGDVYGQEIKVEFLKKIRGEVKFPSIEHLKAQLQKDMAVARQWEQEEKNKGLH